MAHLDFQGTLVRNGLGIAFAQHEQVLLVHQFLRQRRALGKTISKERKRVSAAGSRARIIIKITRRARVNTRIINIGNNQPQQEQKVQRKCSCSPFNDKFIFLPPPYLRAKAVGHPEGNRQPLQRIHQLPSGFPPKLSQS